MANGILQGFTNVFGSGTSGIADLLLKIKQLQQQQAQQQTQQTHGEAVLEETKRHRGATEAAAEETKRQGRFSRALEGAKAGLTKPQLEQFGLPGVELPPEAPGVNLAEIAGDPAKLKEAMGRMKPTEQLQLLKELRAQQEDVQQQEALHSMQAMHDAILPEMSTEDAQVASAILSLGDPKAYTAFLQHRADRVQKPEKVGKLSTQDYLNIAASGRDPRNDQPASPELVKTAQDVQQRVTAHEQHLKEQAEKFQLSLDQKKTAYHTGIRELADDARKFRDFDFSVRTVRGILDSVKKRLSLFPDSVVQLPANWLASKVQTDFGAEIRALQQSTTVLMSREPRLFGEEKGRIPFQLEKLWANVLANPTRVTRPTARALLDESYKRIAEMATGREAVLKRRARTAQGLGVPPEYVEAFTRGEFESLTELQGPPEPLGPGVRIRRP